MNLQNFVNPHIATNAEADVDTDLEMPPMRIRQVTLSPSEEYAARPGQVETIPDALAALILSRKTFVEIGPRGVTIDRKELGGRRRFWHADSPLCNEIGNGEKRRVVAVWNSLDLSCIHLFNTDGRYLETLPAENQPAVFDQQALSNELAEHRRVHERHRAHLQRLHADDSIAALESARANTAEIKRVVTILPAEGVDSGEAQPTPDAIAAERGGAHVRQRIAEHARLRNQADAIFDRPLRRDQPEAVPASKPWDPFDID